MCLDDAQVKALGQLPLKASSVDKHVADLTDGIVMWYARVNYYWTYDVLIWCYYYSKFFDKMIPNTLDVRVINFKIQVKPRDQIENWNLCVNSGRAVGCRMNDIDTKELVKGHKEMLLKVIWQVIKVGLETKMKKNQNLIKKFMDSSDDMENMVRLASDKLILKWVRDIKWHLDTCHALRISVPKREYNSCTHVKCSFCGPCLEGSCLTCYSKYFIAGRQRPSLSTTRNR